MKRLNAFADRIQRDVLLAKYTAARLGGPADWLYYARPDDDLELLVAVVEAAWRDGIPVRFLGGGANVLVSDAGVHGLVVINRVTRVEFHTTNETNTITASSGTGLLMLARQCASAGIGGMEWAVGVPGTVGGAVVNNAGAHGFDMASSVVGVLVHDAERGACVYTNADMQYGYRTSVLKARQDRRFIVLQASLTLPSRSTRDINTTMAEFNAYRKRTQPPGASLGSIFKNPPGDYAGRLIEASGLKGCKIGQVQVSDVHANFIVNLGGATASDYFQLIQYVQAEVHEKQGIQLELEIELVGEW